MQPLRFCTRYFVCYLADFVEYEEIEQKMLTDSVTHDDTKATSLPDDITDDSCKFEYIEIVPLTRDSDGPCTTECDGGDWSAEIKQENLPVVKQEPDDVCYIVLCLLPAYKYLLRIARRLSSVWKVVDCTSWYPISKYRKIQALIKIVVTFMDKCITAVNTAALTITTHHSTALNEIIYVQT